MDKIYNKKINKELKDYFIVPSKNKVTGELLDIKVFTNFNEAQNYQMNNFKENVSKGKFIEKPIIGTFEYSEEGALRKAECMFPEHCIDSSETLELFKESIKEEFY